MRGDLPEDYFPGKYPTRMGMNYDDTKSLEGRTVAAKDAKKVFSRIGFGMFATFLVIQVVQGIMAALIGLFAPAFRASEWFAWLLVGVSSYLFGYPLFFLIVKGLPSYPAGEARWATGREFGKGLVISFGSLYLFNVVSVLLLALIGLLKGQAVTNPLASVTAGSSIWGSLIFGCIGAPILEELVFRKLLINKLRPYGDRLCIFASAFLFALFHGNLSQMLYAFALGAVFAYLTLRTGSCRTTIVLHMIVNLFGMILVPGILNLTSGSVMGQTIASIAVVVFVLLSIVLGLVFFFKSLKRLTFAAPKLQIESGGPIAKFLANPGMICYMAICLLSVVFVLMI